MRIRDNWSLKSLGLACSILFFTASSRAEEADIILRVDASEVARKIVHVDLDLPAVAGQLKLVYPKWIPGDHKPMGPIVDVTGVRFESGGQEFNWKRDSLDMYLFLVDIPPSIKHLQVHFDLVGPIDNELMHLGLSTSSNAAVLNWYQLFFYPADSDTSKLTVAASLRLPTKWLFGTSLEILKKQGDLINFKTVTLSTLADSPVLSGRFFREVDVTPQGETRRHYVDIAAETEAELAIPQEVFQHFESLVRETGVLFGARHYRSYHFLIALQGELSDGVEHHESSDNRLPGIGLVDADWRILHGALFAHEIAHSWNGKFRRPIGLATRNFQEPMQGDLLWIYEGLTSYLGRVLAARSGFLTPDQTREAIAIESASLTLPGRRWRSLEDTAIAAQLLYDASEQWSNWRRSVDFYPEGLLLWLRVDLIIRDRTNGAKSLDDFCRLFAGGQDGPATLSPYDLDEVLKDLDAVVPYPWIDFFRKRVYSVAPNALEEFEKTGWSLNFVEAPSSFSRIDQTLSKRVDLRYSLGMLIGEHAELIDVVLDSPAARAGAAPGMTVISVNGKDYDASEIRQELAARKTTLSFLLADGRTKRTVDILYQGGERNPVLTRIRGPDQLGNIITPRASSPP